MPIWESFIEEPVEVRYRPKKNFNKNKFCKRNKRASSLGHHVYEGNARHCKLCGHFRHKTA